jgi:hypothetical protein
MPDRAFGYGLVLFRRLLGDGGEVATAAVFPEDVENSNISVNVSVVISYSVVVIEVLENVSKCLSLSVGGEATRVGQGAHFCYNVLSISLAHLLKVEFLTREYPRDDHEPGNTKIHQ